MLDQLGIHPLVIFLVNMAFSVVLFAIYRFSMSMFYRKVLYRWHFLSARVERLTQNNAHLIKKYGILGLVIFVALPVPGTGVLGGAILSWFFGLKWHISFLAIIPASAVSNVLITGVIVGFLNIAKLVA